MAGKLRHWKEKDGRFYARVAVPKPLVPYVGKSELIEPLGGDRRAAMRQHSGAVAILQSRIVQAEREAARAGAVVVEPGRFPLEIDQIAASHYSQRLAFDDQLRNDSRYAAVGVDDKHVLHLRAGSAGKLSDIDLALTVGAQIERFRAAGNLTAEAGSDEWRLIARALCAAELEALARVAERDEGDFTGKPENPLIANATPPDEILPPVRLIALFKDYITSRQALGKHKDGARQWERALEHLVKFVGHSDARKMTKRNLLDWRDRLLAEGKNPKTISNVYLASVRAIFRWAHENDRLPTNEADTVRQAIPKKVHVRERGYTTPEAVAVLKASIAYQPATADNPANRESAHITAAKRWIPLLCAFTGARVAEMAQLRKEDVRKEGEHWVARITPDAGSVKAGGYRDVPLHRQVIELGFVEFVNAAGSGPLFHGATEPAKYLSGARTTAGRLSSWLQSSGLVPDGVQPSHGWRHRFKTLGREIGASDRVVDAIQGHAGTTAGDAYGDVSIVARARVITQFPEYDLSK